MDSIYTELALYGSKNLCARTDTVGKVGKVGKEGKVKKKSKWLSMAQNCSKWL